MKRVGFALLIGAVVAFGVPTKENVGCGLGTQLWGSSANDSVLKQSLAATTNGTFGNQTFGITSGTSGCRKPRNFVENRKLQKFVADNMDQLAMDISAGSGESLETLAILLQIPAEKRPLFYKKLKGNFPKIYSSTSVDAAAVIDGIAETL
ncbi:MAG: DUF3015 family protein [Campylobacterales bacterium]|jgi:hypothetical protein